MPQNFLLINKDFGEYIHAHRVGEGATLREWCSGDVIKLLILLLRNSKVTSNAVNDIPEASLSSLSPDPIAQVAGHWVRTPIDRCGWDGMPTIMLIGDQDDSKLYQFAIEHWRDITKMCIEGYNAFIQDESLHMEFQPSPAILGANHWIRGMAEQEQVEPDPEQISRLYCISEPSLNKFVVEGYNMVRVYREINNGKKKHVQSVEFVLEFSSSKVHDRYNKAWYQAKDLAVRHAKRNGLELGYIRVKIGDQKVVAWGAYRKA